jgi:predicted ATPase
MIFEKYQNLIKNGEIVADTYQEKAAKQLQSLEIELLNFDKLKNSLFSFLIIPISK